MSADGLDPFNMRRNIREVSMADHYRKVVYRPEDDVNWEIIRYNGRDTLLDTEQVSEPDDGEYIAVRVQLRLGTSQL